VLSRRSSRFALWCEPLELRQLLSVSQIGPPAAPVPNQVVFQPTIPATPLAAFDTPSGYSPIQMTTGYGVNQISFNGTAGSGAGETIAIIDAYYDKNIKSDLATFDNQFGLTAPPSFIQYNMPGVNQNNGGWALETALDVEWAHAIAPKANIVLVEGLPNLTGQSNLFSAVTYATQNYGATVVSMSWGTGEFSSESSYDSTFTAPGVTYVASSGDSSASEYPAASPNVLSVGGTTLKLSSQGNYVSETGWSGSGGGYSPYEPEPTWQNAAVSASGLQSGHRTTPDISWDANPSTGVPVYSSTRDGGQVGWFQVGGTSVGAPSWAALIAITNQGLAANKVGTLANAQVSLYNIYSGPSSAYYHDITSGSSGVNKAGTGYDLVTGIGSPVANQLVPALVTANLSVVAATAAKHTKAPSGDPPPVVGSATSANTGTQIGTGLSSTSSSSPTSGSSITALNPNLTAGNSTLTLTPVIIVPPPLPPPVIHLAASAPPNIAQIVNSAIASQEEQPPSLTHFGQGPDHEPYSLLPAPTDHSDAVGPPIDIVEPFQPVAPADAGAGRLLAPGGPLCGWNQPLFTTSGIDAAIEQGARGLMADSGESAPPTQEESGEAGSAWGYSTLFGAAVVVAGGYRLAISEREPFGGRWLTRRFKTARLGRRGFAS
jgi:hypothetical protein